MDAIVLCVCFVPLPSVHPAEYFGVVSTLESAIVTRSRSCHRCVFAPAAVSAPCGCVPHGQWAFLDADMPVLVGRSACLVEPLCFSPVSVLQAASSELLRRSRRLIATASSTSSLEALSCSPGRHLACAAQVFLLDVVIPTWFCHPRLACLRNHMPLISFMSISQANSGWDSAPVFLCNSRLLSTRQLDLVMSCFLNSSRPNCRLSNLVASSLFTVKPSFEYLSCQIFVTFATLAFNMVMLFVTALVLSPVATNCSVTSRLTLL